MTTDGPVENSIRFVASVAESAGGGGGSVRSGPPTSIGYYRINGKPAPMKVVQGCKVCGLNDWREAVDNALAVGVTFVSIAEHLPEKVRSWDKEVTITPLNLKRHFSRGHLPMADTLRRQALEETFELAGNNPLVDRGRMTNHISALNEVVHIGIERLLKGEIEVDVGNLIGAARALIHVDSIKQQSVNQEHMTLLLQKSNEAWMQVVSGLDSGRIPPTEEAIVKAWGTILGSMPEVASMHGRNAIIATSVEGMIPALMSSPVEDAEDDEDDEG